MNIMKISAGTLAINYGMQKLCEDSGMILEAVKKDHPVLDKKKMIFLFTVKYSLIFSFAINIHTQSLQ